ALPDLEDVLNKCAVRLAEPPRESFELLICFTAAMRPGYNRLAREIFDWFRCPVIELDIDVGETETSETQIRIKRIRARTIDKLEADETTFLKAALHDHTRREWRSPKTKTPADWSLAVLYDPKEELPPSSFESLKRFARIAEKMKVDVDPITRRDIN